MIFKSKYKKIILNQNDDIEYLKARIKTLESVVSNLEASKPLPTDIFYYFNYLTSSKFKGKLTNSKIIDELFNSKIGISRSKSGLEIEISYSYNECCNKINSEDLDFEIVYSCYKLLKRFEDIEAEVNKYI